MESKSDNKNKPNIDGQQCLCVDSVVVKNENYLEPTKEDLEAFLIRDAKKKLKISPIFYILLAGSLSIIVALLWFFLPYWNETTTAYDYKMLHITTDYLSDALCDDNYFGKEFYCLLENTNSSTNLPKCISPSKNLDWDKIERITNDLKTREDVKFVDYVTKITWMSVGTLRGDNSIIATEDTNVDLRLFKMNMCLGKVKASVVLVEGLMTKIIRSRSILKKKPTSFGVRIDDSENIRPDFSPIINEFGDIEWTPCTLNDIVVQCKGISTTFPYVESYQGSSTNSQNVDPNSKTYDPIGLRSIENTLLISGKMTKRIQENDVSAKKKAIKSTMGLFEMPAFKKEFVSVTNYWDKIFDEDESTKPEILTKFYFSTDTTARQTYQLGAAVRGLLGLDR